MSQTIENIILAVVTTEVDRTAGSGPIFIVKDEAELQQVCFNLENVLDGMAHEVRPGTMVIVRH
ncbi:MAG: hypothetical protein JWN30_13 [Bacilli bacterium]|nr:hypothetical protein [Bacilli bacterium]